ncbi:uncharacterized protein LOC112567786 [Pomacea canaliculata]|uniref:uncharacterized protein LOC112567786 n=1 Tax=Pomacea canaliculata TaxID=400727 RepID=UPI000D727127|nr:uncharacterized protein LOC112567786 [Pomacea canaliculata]XP_025100401.1 uncharacterized protein LOC112567786 [Pomacea canaliculata]
MTCYIESSRLHCTSTNEIQGLSLYSKPDGGDERRVFICPSLNDNECSNFNGVRLINHTHVEITLSEHENITFRCVMRGSQSLETQRCRWTPGAESQNGTSTVETHIGKMKELTLGKAATFSPEPEIKDISTETIIGAVFGALVAIILIMAVGYLLFRHFKSKRNLEGPRKRSISCIKAQKSELCAWYICADNDLNSQAAVGADASPTPLLTVNSAHTPNREEENSKMKDDDEVSTSVIKIKNGGLGTLGEKKHINGKT